MNYILQLTTGGKFKITKDEAMAFANAKDDQSITIQRIGIVIPKRMAIIYPENGMEETREQQFGRLHDGTKVKRHFGQWVDAEHSAVDDKGNYSPVKLNPSYYPEAYSDNIFTEEEYQNFKALPDVEKQKLLKTNEPRKSNLEPILIP